MHPKVDHDVLEDYIFCDEERYLSKRLRLMGDTNVFQEVHDISAARVLCSSFPELMAALSNSPPPCALSCHNPIVLNSSEYFSLRTVLKLSRVPHVELYLIFPKDMYLKMPRHINDYHVIEDLVCNKDKHEIKVKYTFYL